MTKYILISLLFGFCLMTIPAAAQVPKNELLESINKTKKEISDLEKKIADAKTNKEDPAIIKMMEDQLPLMKEMLTALQDINKDLAKTQEQTPAQDDNIVSVPKRDNKRINMLPDGILSDAQLVVFVKKIHSEVERLLSLKTRTEALKIYNAAKAEKRSSDYISNIATSLWILGCVDLATYILGKECNAVISNTNNLNNYAAFLTMTGAEHAAIPLLQHLNNKYPNNSTILNNIGQAWYGLGDMNNANRFLDSAIKLYPRHSQANITKSKIQQADGKTQEAIKSIKQAILENYTPEKEARLVKLGGKLEFADLPFRYKIKSEPLGIEKFILTIPPYIMDGGMAAANNEMEWNDFKNKIRAALDQLNTLIESLEKKADAYNIRFLTNPMIIKPYNNTIYRTARRKRDLLFEWIADRLPRLDKKMREAKDSVDKWRMEYNAARIAHKEYNNKLGIPGDCGVLKSLAVAFNVKANTLWIDRNRELLSINKQFANAQTNLSLYASTDKSQYDLWIAKLKAGILGTLFNLHHETEVGCIPQAPKEQFGKVLPDFDSLTCKYENDIFIPPFTVIKIRCNQMSTEFNVDSELGLKFKLAFEEDLNGLNKKGVQWYNPLQTLTKGTLEVAYEKSLNEGLTADGLIDKQHLGGPFKGELKAQGAVGIEFTGDRLIEVYIKGAISGELTGFVEGNNDFMDSKGSGIFNVEMKSSWNVGSKDTEGFFSTDLSGQGLSSGEIFKSVDWSTPQIKSK